MADVSVRVVGGGEMRVEVRDGDRVTVHLVTVDPAPAALGLPGVDDATLVRASFDFLLEREPAGSILRRFRLGDIATYFPEWRQEVRGRLGA